MIIDFHSHILPGIDDGARTLEESIQIVKAMSAMGFDRITCTPHITKKYRNTLENIKERFDLLVTGMKDSGSNVATALAVFIAIVLYFGIAWLFGIVDSTISNVIPDFNNNLIKRKNKNEQRREDKVFTKQRAL